MATEIKDQFNNTLNHLDNIGGEVFTDTRISTATLAAINAEVVMFCQNTNSASVEVRNTFVGTMLIQYSIDGTNYDSAPIFNPITELFLANISTTGKYITHLPSGTKQVRVLMNTFTSGSALVSLRGSQGDNFVYAKQLPTTLTVTATGVLSAGVTLSLPAPGLNLYHYITNIIVDKYIGATLTASATPIIVTTTNINGLPSFNFKTLGTLGDSEVKNYTFKNPLKSLVSNTATTVVCPVFTGVIWKVTVFYYIGA